MRSLWLRLHWEHGLCAEFFEERLFKYLLYARPKGWPNPVAASQELLVLMTSQEQVHKSSKRWGNIRVCQDLCWLRTSESSRKTASILLEVRQINTVSQVAEVRVSWR